MAFASRLTAHQRGYTAAWRKARIQHLREYPLCERHLKRGELVPGRVVDHRIPHRGDPNLFWDPANWQTLCDHCHSSDKQLLERSGVERGCDVHGWPLASAA